VSKGPKVVHTVDGAKVFRKAMDDLGKKVRGKIVRKALRKGAKILAAEVKSEAPEDTGKLKASVKVKAGKRKKDVISILVDVSGGHETSFVAAIEYGKLTAKAHPFIRPSFEKKKDEVASVLLDEVRRGIESV
jgi:HK97 gp10 family phage protein